MARHVRKVPKLEFGNIIATYYEKSVATAFVFYCDAKYCRYFTRVQSRSLLRVLDRFEYVVMFALSFCSSRISN